MRVTIRKILVTLAFGGGLLRAQSTTKPAAASPAQPGNFAIETEMLTYRALESNSEAIACDVTGYLNGVPANFSNPPAGAVCDVKGGAAKSTIVLLPFDNSQLADFQVWRTDMATMERLQRKAGDLSCQAGGSRGATSATVSTLGSLLSGTPAGPHLALAQGALALMAREESTTPVAGTVQDQAFMDGVGRELRALNVLVLMPAAYVPFSLAPLDVQDSPFLASLERTLAAQECLLDLPASGDALKLNRAKALLIEIDAFIATLVGSADSAGSKQAPPATPGAGQTTATAKTSPAVATHLVAVLSADGIAKKLGVEARTGQYPDGGTSVHVLMVKALESGGAVSHRTNVFGGSIHYSGGSVGTFALFTIAGELECSGNVYDYAGSASAKEFQRDLRNFNPEPNKQMIFLHGGCSATIQRR